MKRAKVLSIMLTSAMVSATLGTTPIFAAEDININNGDAVKVEAAEAAAESSIKIDVSNGTSANIVAPTITITNTGNEKLDLNNLKLKYFYTNNGYKKQTFNCYYAGTTNGEYQNLTNNIVGKVSKPPVLGQINPSSAKNNSYIQISFKGGSLEAGQSAQIQAAVNKEDWSDYDQSNDFSYNNGENIAAYENNKLIWGNEPNGGSVNPPVEIKDSKLDKTSISVDKADVKDETVNISLNGNTFTGITGLTEGTDYTVANGNVVVLKSSYLNNLAAGNTTLTFNFNQGAAQTLNVNVKDVVKPPVEIKDSKLDKTSISVDKADVKDETINISLNGNTFTGITGLTEGTDYTVTNGNVVVLKSSYLKNLAAGNTTLTFNFNQGASQKLSVNVKDVVVTPDLDAVISPETVDYNKEDVTVQMTLNGKTLSSIKNNNAELVSGTDYVLDGDKVVLKQSYLDTLPQGQATALTFNFSNGKSKTLKVNVAKAVTSDSLIINMANVNAQEGENITIPVTITGIDSARDLVACNFTVRYDTNIFENASVTPGDIVVNAPKTFFKSINKNTGSIGVMFADSTGKELEKISKDGIFVNINLKVKDGVKNATTQLKLTKPGKYADKFLKPYKINYEIGTITIGNGQDDPVAVVDSKLTKTSAEYDINNPQSVEVGMDLNGNTLSSIKNGGKELTNNVDYTVNGTNVTFAPQYLASLEKGNYEFTFSFNKGADAKFNLNVIKTEEPVEDVLAAAIGNIEAKAGETVVLPVTLTKAPERGIAAFNYKISYNPELMDIISVKAGDAITTPELNFDGQAFENNKMVSVVFIDYNVTEEDTIKTGGVLTNIELKIKDGVKPGVIPIEFKNIDDSVFCDLDEAEVPVRFDAGSITVK